MRSFWLITPGLSCSPVLGAFPLAPSPVPGVLPG
nr:MAG TPA_asm: hypothetical protein [Bacteriophage sp.]